MSRQWSDPGGERLALQDRRRAPSRRSASVALVLAGTAVVVAFACSSATSPRNLTGPYVGNYKMDSVTASALDSVFPPNGTLDSADGVTGTMKLTKDSFYIALAGNFPRRDSGTFTISGSNQWTLDGSLFSGTGTGALAGNDLHLTLTGGTAIPSMYGLFTKQ
jgi:hypothetical protein